MEKENLLTHDAQRFYNKLSLNLDNFVYRPEHYLGAEHRQVAGYAAVSVYALMDETRVFLDLYENDVKELGIFTKIMNLQDNFRHRFTNMNNFENLEQVYALRDEYNQTLQTLLLDWK